MSLHALSEWLANTSLSMTIQNTSWVIPTVQSIHIVAIAAVVSSICMMDLRVFGLFGRDMTLGSVVQRFLPWVWYSLIVLLVTGSILVIGEPGRSLENPAFQAKVLMIVTVIIITLVFAMPLRNDGEYWEQSGGRRAIAVLIAIVTMILWSLIVFAGRWIAYVSV